MNLDYIDDLVDVDMCYLYYKGKAILSANTMVKLKKEVKENIEEPAEDKEVYIISFGKSTNKEKLLFVHCGECVITPTLNLVTEKHHRGKKICESE